MTFIAVTQYFNMLTAIVAIPKYTTPPLDTLEQLWDSDRKWMSDYHSNNDYYLKYFEYVENIKGRFYNSTTVLNASRPSLAALKEVMSEKGTVVFFKNKDIVEFYIAEYDLESNTDLKYYYSKETFDPLFMALYFRKSCYFSEHLNRAILRLRSMYIQVILSNQYTATFTTKSKVQNLPQPSVDGLIKLEHLVTAGVIIGGVCFVSLISFITEILYMRIMIM